MNSILFKLLFICLIPTSLIAQDWKTVLCLSPQGVIDVCWVNETTAYAVSAIYNGDFVNVKKTSDGGLTWEEQYVGIPQMNFREIASPNNGGDVFIIGNDGTLIHSDNGGDNWNTIDIGTTLSLRDIFFLSNTIGYISSDYATIFKTTDGGMTWTLLHENMQYGVSIKKICFINEQRGFIVGFNFFYETFDGGLNWTPAPGFETFSTELYQINDIQFLDENIGYISGDLGLLFKTSDAGKSWVDKHVDYHYPNASIKSFKFLDSDPNIGFACGSYGLLIRTYDAGDNWELMSSDAPVSNEPNKPYFYALDFYGDKGLLVGQSIILGYGINATSTSEIIKLFPNPVNDVLTFIICVKRVDEVQVIDMNGKVCKVIINPVNNNIQCGDLLSGEYILRIISEETTSHKLFIKY